MKILYITLENMSLHKGSVVHVKEMVSELRKLGHQVGLIAVSQDSFEEAEYFYGIRLRRPSLFLSCFFLFFYLCKLVHQYDIIYARDYHTVMIAYLPRWVFKKKLVFEIDGIAFEEQRLKGNSLVNRLLSSLMRQAERIATAYSDRIVSVTPQIASHLVDVHRCPRAKVRVISNGVNTKSFHPIHDELHLSYWKEKLGIGRGEIVVVFVGNLARWQGVGFLIDAALPLLAREEPLKFLIVGDGPVKKDLIRKVSESCFERKFVFTGMVNYKDIPFLINVSDICVAPFISRRNRMTGVSPLKVYEYLSCGKPVVASRIEGLEFIEKEGVGHLVEPGDVKELEEALFDLIVSPEKRAEMGSRGGQIAKERFDWGKKAVEIEKLLKELA